MRSLKLQKLAAGGSLALALVFGAVEANAQGRGQIVRQQEKVIKQQQKLEKERLKLEQERLRAERERLQARNNNGNRFRVYRNGSWYNTDRRGTDILRQAVQEGYRQGFQAGTSDRRSRRNLNWGGSSVYRSGIFGWNSHVDRGQYQYYFQQGFQRGYQDGFNNRNQFGTNTGGGLNILGSILTQLLDIRQY